MADWRVQASQEFDRLWRLPTREMTRGQAYRWLARTLQLPAHRANLQELDESQCRRLIQAVQTRKPR